MQFAKYTYGNTPSALPLSSDGWNDCDEADIRAAGFDPEDEEIQLGILTADWNGHPAGAVVVSGLNVAGHPFAVQSDCSEPTEEMVARCLNEAYQIDPCDARAEAWSKADAIAVAIMESARASALEMWDGESAEEYHVARQHESDISLPEIAHEWAKLADGRFAMLRAAYLEAEVDAVE